MWIILFMGAIAFLISVLRVFWEQGLEKSDLKQLRVFIRQSSSIA